MMKLGRTAAVAAAILLGATFAPAQAGDGHHDDDVETVVDGLDGPRGVDHLFRGKTLVTEADGTFSLVIERWHDDPKVIELGSVPATGLAPAIAAGPHRRIYLLTGAGGEPGQTPSPGATTLFEWEWGDDEPEPVFDVAAYQETDPDPYDLEGLPGESNPFGLAALRDGSVLIADAAGNDLIRVWPDGRHDPVTVARLKPRTVEVPEGLPETGPDGSPLPPAGAELPSEAVATSVTVGPDGHWYVGELRGFPATPETSQIWRIKPGSVDAVCDPEHPWNHSCKRYADGLTSIVDLGADHHSVYALSLSKMSWLAWELEVEGAEIGGLFKVTRWGHKVWVRELAEDQLVLPAGVDVGWDPYVTGPIFGPGSLVRID